MAWMIYGANGYTGELIAQEAARRGMTPVLAGRNAQAVAAVAESCGFESSVFDLSDEAVIRRKIRGMRAVLHCAGPFSVTSLPMLRACLAEGVHYADITGEISVFEQAHAMNDEAVRADVAVIPGAGFDVVPTDCLAATLVESLPAATRLCLAFEMGGGLSPGTARTSAEGLAHGGMVRKDGKLTPVPLAWKKRKVRFPHAVRTVVTIPWGDVYTAWVSTGVPDIEVYIAVPPARIRQMRLLRHVQPLLRLKPVQAWLQRQAGAVEGPSADTRAASQGYLWGQAESADGRRLARIMTTPNGYELTVSASLGIVEHLLSEDVEGGYYTPSLLMGAGYAASLPGVEVSAAEVSEPCA